MTKAAYYLSVPQVPVLPVPKMPTIPNMVVPLTDATLELKAAVEALQQQVKIQEARSLILEALLQGLGTELAAMFQSTVIERAVECALEAWLPQLEVPELTPAVAKAKAPLLGLMVRAQLAPLRDQLEKELRQYFTLPQMKVPEPVTVSEALGPVQVESEQQEDPVITEKGLF